MISRFFRSMVTAFFPYMEVVEEVDEGDEVIPQSLFMYSYAPESFIYQLPDEDFLDWVRGMSTGERVLNNDDRIRILERDSENPEN